MLAVTTRKERKITLNTIGIVVMMILLIIIVIITSQWDKEVQIRKIYDKYFLDIASSRRKINVKAKTYQQENVELKKQLSRAKNDIKIVEDTYKTKIDELENEIVNLNYKKQLKNGELEFREPAEVEDEEQQETKD